MIVTTIFRFADAGLLNDRANIVVMVDEAHRTQEGRLGLDMREALPNAKFIGLTGTPISTDDRNTWATFGDPDDPDGVLNHYSRRALDRRRRDAADPRRDAPRRLPHRPGGARRGVRGAGRGRGPRRATSAGYLARRAQPGRHADEDPGPHRRPCARTSSSTTGAKVAPLGLKAQVVAFDRELCVRYHDAITRAAARPGEEATVVMTTAKDDPPEWAVFDRDRTPRQRIKDRFLRPRRPAALPHRHGQAADRLRRTRRGRHVPRQAAPGAHAVPGRRPARTGAGRTRDTGQEKLYGLVVDYVGLGNGARQGRRRAGHRPGRKALPTDTSTSSSTLLAEYVRDVRRPVRGRRPDRVGVRAAAWPRRSGSPTVEARAASPSEFLRCEGLFEFLWPDTACGPSRTTTAGSPASTSRSQPTGVADALLWHRLGAKTAELIAEHLTASRSTTTGLETIAIDAGVFEALRATRPVPRRRSIRHGRPPCDEVLDTIEARLRRKLDGPDVHPVWRSLADRLEAAAAARLADAAASVEFLKQLLDLARASRRSRGPRPTGRSTRSRSCPTRTRARSRRSSRSTRPPSGRIIEHVVEEIDAHRPARPRIRLAESSARRPRGPPAAPPRPARQRPPGDRRPVRPGLRLHPRALLTLPFRCAGQVVVRRGDTSEGCWCATLHQVRSSTPPSANAAPKALREPTACWRSASPGSVSRKSAYWPGPADATSAN